jgi:hypothetical protein
MKKLLLLFMLVYVGTVNAQESNKVYKNEISIDALHLVLGNVGLSYEYLINENSGFGLYGEFNVDNNRIWEIDAAYGINYRLYVGSRYASGFFLEGGLGGYTTTDYYNSKEETTFLLGPTFALGGKFVIRKQLVFQFFGGLGRNFISKDKDNSVYYEDQIIFPRFGVSIGTRF